jgi:hypothetical protein
MGRSATLLLPLALAFSASCATRAATPAAVVAPAAPSLSAAEFAGLIQSLSEPGGFFPSDNLVSNETSYLHPLGKMAAMFVHGGAYLGVGPDQNFSYIAAVRPEIAFMIDIRRDNLLEHLLFKAAFANSRNRLEYLSFMTGRRTPHETAAWDTADIERIVAWIDSMPVDPRTQQEIGDRALHTVAGFGYALSPEDLTQIERIHQAFFNAGLDVRYSNRGWMSSYPNWRMLILAKDLDNRRANYLASEEGFRFLKDLERRNLVVPVTGDLSGPHALAAIGQEIARRGLHVSVFYVSNVEQYLFQGGGFDPFAETVSALPRDEHSVIIRSFFRGRHPQNVPGHSSTQLMERIDDFAIAYQAGAYRTYLDVVLKNVIPLRN